MAAAPLARLRALCLCLPEAYEQRTWDTPTFRVASKMFVVASEGADGRPSASMKATRDDQAELLSVGDPYFFPAYVGSKGWIGVRLDSRELDWDELGQLVVDSYCLVAPRRLTRALAPAERPPYGEPTAHPGP